MDLQYLNQRIEELQRLYITSDDDSAEQDYAVQELERLEKERLELEGMER